MSQDRYVVYEERKDPFFIDYENNRYADIKKLDLKGRFSTFYSFDQQNNHISSFAMALFCKIGLKSNSGYKSQLTSLVTEGRTFCNVVTRVRKFASEFDTFEGTNKAVYEIFEDSLRNFQSMNFPDACNYNNSLSDIEFYRQFVENTFAVRILSKLFGVSSVIYKIKSDYSNGLRIEVISPELQNYRPTLYFYAFFNDKSTYILYTMIPRLDRLEVNQSKRVIFKTKNIEIGKNIIYTTALSEYLSSINSLYNKVMRNSFHLRDDIQAFDKKIRHELNVIRANKKCNRIEFVLNAFSESPKIKSKILKYENLNLNIICSYCFGMDNANDKIFSLDCLCLFHSRCFLIYVNNLFKSGYNLTCYCGVIINQNFYLGLIEIDQNRESDRELLFKTNIDRKFCDQCKMDSSTSASHNKKCQKSLCESCMIKFNNKTCNCSYCKNPFDTFFELRNYSIFCKSCLECKKSCEMFIPKESDPVGCYECYILGKFPNSPESLRNTIIDHRIQCKNDFSCRSIANETDSFLHPGKKSCPQCQLLCFYCVLGFEGYCPLCSSKIEVNPDLFEINT